MNLRLHVTQFINGLHLAGHSSANTAELTTGVSKALERLILKRRNTGQEDFQCVDITRIGDVELAVVLRKRIKNGVQLFLFFSLILPVGIHGQAERIFPFGPVGNLDPFELFERKCIFTILIGKVPIQITGQQAIFVFDVEFLGCHRGYLLVMSSRSG